VKNAEKTNQRIFQPGIFRSREFSPEISRRGIIFSLFPRTVCPLQPKRWRLRWGNKIKKAERDADGLGCPRPPVF
jgi:hypothetical protein